MSGSGCSGTQKHGCVQHRVGSQVSNLGLSEKLTRVPQGFLGWFREGFWIVVVKE